MTVFGAFVIILLIVFIIFLNHAMKDGWYFFLYHTGIQKKLITDADRERINNYLNNFPYYFALSTQGKEKFVNRLFIFMMNKQFRARSGLVITEEMRVLISASAIQLTFGLENYRLESLQIIFIYPDTFYLSQRSPEYKGATTAHYMYLSWKAFQEGYRRSDDNLNLGLHEMTHALKLTLYLGARFDSFFAGRMEYWETLVAEKFKQFSQTPTFLRSYSRTNTEEFFAVCVEAFFESPEKFKRELPEIFQLLTFLLNQDVLNATNDYQINTGHFTDNIYKIPYPEHVKTSYKYSNNHWSLNILAIGAVGFIPTVFIVSKYFLFPGMGYFLLLAIMGTLGLFQKRYFSEHKILSGGYFVLYAYAGFGSTFTMLLLWLNFLIPVTTTYVEKISITHLDQTSPFQNLAVKHVELLRELSENRQLLDLDKSHGSKYLVFNYHYGILGIKKVDSVYFTD